MTNELSKQVDNLLSLIPSGRYTPKQLRQLYINVTNHGESGQITDAQAEALVAAIETQIRTEDPRAANKLLGPANRKSREILEAYLNELMTKFDLSDNKHRTTVKTGGGVIAGTEVCDDYISYRHPTSKTVAAINLGKQAHDAPLHFLVAMTAVGAPIADGTRVQFEETEIEAAKELFEANLQRVMRGETV